MATYKNVLVAVDLTEESNEVLGRARAFCSKEVKIRLLHVVQPIAGPYLGAFPGAQTVGDRASLVESFKKTAQNQLEAIAKAGNVDPSACEVLIGPPAAEIRKYAKEHDIDLIVIGTHGQHGLGLLLGSTANGVLHGACCDVLAVRIWTD